jgi:hypothetical protein
LGDFIIDTSVAPLDPQRTVFLEGTTRDDRISAVEDDLGTHEITFFLRKRLATR